MTDYNLVSHGPNNAMLFELEHVATLAEIPTNQPTAPTPSPSSSPSEATSAPTSYPTPNSPMWDGNTLVDGNYIIRTQKQSTFQGSSGCAADKCINDEDSSCVVIGNEGADADVTRDFIGEESKLCGCSSVEEILAKPYLYWEIKHLGNNEHMFSINGKQYHNASIIRLDDRHDYVAIMGTPCCENTGGSDKCWHFGQHSTVRWDGHYAFTWCGTNNAPGYNLPVVMRFFGATSSS